MWPATAVTLHIDGTGPDNGFLRVVPGSHLWSMPAPYENINGAVVPDGSAERGGYPTNHRLGLCRCTSGRFLGR